MSKINDILSHFILVYVRNFSYICIVKVLYSLLREYITLVQSINKKAFSLADV